MTRDNRDRLETFVGTPVSVSRLALNRQQIDQLNPPENPAKLSDARAAQYVAEHGYSSWELDALDPAYIRNLIDGAVSQVRDEDVWSISLRREVAERERLEEMAAEFE